MRVLYKDENENIAVMEAAKAAYDPDEEVLELCGSEQDIAVRMTEKDAERIVKMLYANDMADVTAYDCCEMEYDDDFFDDDDEDDDNDFIERMIDLDFGPGSKKDRIVFRED